MPPVAKKIPTNIITGVLGAGKTTAIQSLLDQKPDNQRWAIVINEYGQVSIDNALLDHSPDIEIMELASGCVCCTMSLAFAPLLAQLIRRVKPDRLIIEPSGSGHPTRIIDMLRGKNFGQVLDLRATICMVDPADFDNPRITRSTLFHDQLHMADCVVISWIDKRPAEVVQACRQKIAALDPPKSMVYETSLGRLDPAWLDTAPSHSLIPIYDPDHPEVISQEVTGTSTAVHPAANSMASELPTIVPQLSSRPQGSVEIIPMTVPNKPRRFENQGNGQWACGWIFSAADVFDRDKLVETLEQIAARRVKGIFHCQDDWWAVNRKEQESSLQPSSYRSDSRLEIIADQPLDWNGLEVRLLEARLPR